MYARPCVHVQDSRACFETVGVCQGYKRLVKKFTFILQGAHWPTHDQGSVICLICPQKIWDLTAEVETKVACEHPLEGSK